MNRPRRTATVLPSLLALLGAACGGPPPATTPTAPAAPAAPAASTTAAPPPAPDAFRDARPPTGTTAPHEYPLVETARLGNGVSIYVVHQPVGFVSLSLVARSHASRLPAGKSGLAALTLRMMTEGTTKRTSLRLAEAVESLGSSLEQSAARDVVRLGVTTLREDMERGLSLLAEVATTPAFPQADLERVRREWLDAIEAERQNPSRVASLVGLRLLLGERVGAPVNGSRKDLAALRRADLVSFHRATFVPENLAVVAVGDTTLAAVTTQAEALLGSLRGTRRVEPPAVEPQAAPSSATTVHVVDRPGAVQSALFIGQPFPRRGEPGHEARELLVNLFGGLFTSRLNTNLREEHAYTYGARAMPLSTQDWGALAVMTSVRTDVTAEALTEALSELREIGTDKPQAPPTEQEIARARVDLIQQLGQSLADAGEVRDNVEVLFAQRLPEDYLRKYPPLLNALDPTAVASEARRVDPARSVIVVVGDVQVIAPTLKARGFEVRPVAEALTD